jgi:hypothetical protein
MINDHTHKNALSNIAIRLFSITPHSVMPERLFSILDWQHTKRRNRLSPFTLEAIAKIHTFYTNELNKTDDTTDMGCMEELLQLTDDSHISSGICDESNNSITDATDFMQCLNDNHQILRAKCEAECINEEQSSDNEDMIQPDRILNTDDRDFQQILIDLGFIDDIHLLSTHDDEKEEDESADKISNDDYDVDELLTSTMVI